MCSVHSGMINGSRLPAKRKSGDSNRYGFCELVLLRDCVSILSVLVWFALAGGYLVVQPTELGRRTNWLYFCRREIQILKLYFFELYVFKDFLFL